ncbi:MAG: hypothetical protein ABI939_00485 [Anaerolineaceae bacterium]
MSFFYRLTTRFVVLTALTIPILGATLASAQFQPPSTVFGSVTDAAGPIAAGLPVEAYIGTTLCGTKGKTELTGEGASRVTVYFVDVFAESQTPGCGKDGAEVRIKLGDRFAAQTTRWKAGPVQLDVTFGNATPAVIPTFTPAPATPTTPPRNSPAAGSPTQTPAAEAAVGTIPAGSPGAGSPVPTLKGGVTSSTPAAQRSSAADDGGGFPIWGVVLLVLLGVGAIGGGVGYAMSRSRTADDIEPDDQLPPLE